MTILGSKLPEPYFTLVVQSKQGFRHFRRCLVCRYVSTTVEVPIATRPQNSPADCCPMHPRTKGVVLHQLSPTRSLEKNMVSTGLLRAVTMGGVWRRRACGQNYDFRMNRNKNHIPKDPPCMLCRDAHGKPTRWSTVELDSTGVVVRDVSICSNCGGRTRAYRGTKARLEDWRTPR